MAEGAGERRARALIVDDEPLAIRRLCAALEPMDDVEVAGTCSSGAEAATFIQQEQPDLVFLDVQMPGMDGFDLLATVAAEAMPVVVFVTAHTEHAVRAFEVHAADYLLKPFDDARLAECVEHAVRRVRTNDRNEMVPMLRHILGAMGQTLGGDPRRSIRRLLVRDRDHMRFVEVDQVDYFEAAGNYVRLRVGESSYLIRASLALLATQLDQTWFVRIHRSTIVNVRRIREVQPWASGDYLALLDDGRTLKVSRTYSDDLLKTAV